MNIEQTETGRFILELGELPWEIFKDALDKIFGINSVFIKSTSEIMINDEIFTIDRDFGELYMISRTKEGDKLLNAILQSLTQGCA